MSYKPKQCCECGEKIERTNWRIWTNKRFCQFCETQHGLPDLLYKIAFALLILTSIVGIGNLFRKPEKDLVVVSNQTATAANTTNSNGSRNFVAPTNTAQNVNQTNGAPTANQTKQIAAPEMKSALASTVPNSSEKVKENENRTAAANSQEIVYFCGAQTKKGTPCIRRVRGGGRCFQHVGQPAMLPPEKLIASR